MKHFSSLRQQLNEYKVIVRMYKFIMRYKLWFTFKVSGLSGAEMKTFVCNICGTANKTPIELTYEKESQSCYYCGSTMRLRSVIHLLSLGLFDRSIPISEFPYSQKKGIGMSDPDIYDSRLEKKIKYQNTFYHKEPKLDITSIADSAGIAWDQAGSDPFKDMLAMSKKYDFIISSEVFEHIEPPIEVAFENLHRLLNRNGFCVFTVPYALNGKMKEYFADLFDYRIGKIKGKKVLINKTKKGKEQIYPEITFHGGHGQTLEMRVFTKEDLLKILREAGFGNIVFHKIEKPEYGIVWNENQSLPLTMTR